VREEIQFIAVAAYLDNGDHLLTPSYSVRGSGLSTAIRLPLPTKDAQKKYDHELSPPGHLRNTSLPRPLRPTAYSPPGGSPRYSPHIHTVRARPQQHAQLGFHLC